MALIQVSVALAISALFFGACPDLPADSDKNKLYFSCQIPNKDSSP